MPSKTVYICERCEQNYKTKEEADKCCPEFLECKYSNLKLTSAEIIISEYPYRIILQGEIYVKIKKLKSKIKIPVYSDSRETGPGIFNFGNGLEMLGDTLLKKIPELQFLSNTDFQDLHSEFEEYRYMDTSEILKNMKKIKIKITSEKRSINLICEENK